ncbi:hypothetical protein AVEN_229999-1 [Araneus ventricosus]|uniref:Uncharacterized protein n=1 Tax=Araneus ventricosus TaxID=182803 RepID=A0A4Y2CUG2_ARAVE|nr:hypothetical protein AVEN_229999-1 [Araneus ventricosus]
MVCSEISLGGHSDLDVLHGGTLTVVKYRDWILDPHVGRKGWSAEDARRKVEIWMDLNSLIAGRRGCSDTEVANYENIGQDCGNGTKALDSTEKTIEGTRKKQQLIGIWTEKTGFSLEKVEQIMYLPS